MGALVTKSKSGDDPAAAGGAASYAPGQIGIGPDGVLRDPVVDGILNLENRQITPEIFAKISTISSVTKQVVSLSLANNRLTTLVFDEAGGASTAAAAASSSSSSSSHKANTGAVGSSPFAAPVSLPFRDHGHGHGHSGAGVSIIAEEPGEGENNSMLGGEVPEREGSLLNRPPSASSASSSSSSAAAAAAAAASSSAKALAALVVPLRSSASWPSLENLDLSGNAELFNYSGLNSVGATLKSLRLAHNGIFKIPLQIWALTNLTKLDLSHNRLLTLPPGVALLVQLHALKLSHNSLSSSGSTTCIPEEMRLCSRLRRLDLSHNKLRELPVNWRVDKENQMQAQRRSVISKNAAAAAAAASAASGAAGASPRMGSVTRAGGGADPTASPSQAGRSMQSRSANTGSATAAAAAPAAAPSPTSAAASGAAAAAPVLRGGGAFGKLADPPASPTAAGGALPALTLPASGHAAAASAAAAAAAVSASIAASVAAAASVPPIPIKYFDPLRVSYIQITLLNLSNNQIDSLSPSIGLLRNLNSLNLGYNKLRSLPTEIALLSELKFLDLRFNQLPSLLTEICCLPRLSKLCLQNNRLTSLPYEIRRLKKLTHFFLSSNQLVDLPDVISEVRNVRVLKLCNNRLLTLPDSVFRLQKLRLLDLSFNKLTYLSPEVSSMPLIEDLRLWGNKLKDLPVPILYSEVKKIQQYMRATERERIMMITTLRLGMVGGLAGAGAGGPRSYSRLSLKTQTPTTSKIGRAQSATRAASTDERHYALGGGGGGNHRFAPLGFYQDDREDSNGMGAYSSRAVGSVAAGGSNSARPAQSSLSHAPTSGRGSAGGGGASSMIGTSAGAMGSARRGSSLKDSGSDNEDMHGSDDEFTSMFRAVTSRTGSFTNLGSPPGQIDHAAAAAAGGAGAHTGRSTSSSRRSTTAQQVAAGGALSGRGGGVGGGPNGGAGALGSSPRDGISNTIVQPFSSAIGATAGGGRGEHFHTLSITTAGIAPYAGGGGPGHSPGAGSARGLKGSPSGPRSGRRGLTRGGAGGASLGSAGAGLNRADRSSDDDDDASSGSDGDGDGRDGAPHAAASPAVPDSDVLTEVVRREWKPLSLLGMGEVGSPTDHGHGHGHHLHPHAHTHGHGHGSRASSAQRRASASVANEPAAAAQLMEEWDTQSMAIEQQQGKATGRGKVGAK